MPPNSSVISSTAGFEPVPDSKGKGVDGWLDYRRDVDGAEGYWRVHDNLYDLTDFIDRHPGGSEWLELTKGTDITEAFETHHIYETAPKLLSKFLVRKATRPRISPFTFNEDGFYKTLKKRVRAIIKDAPKRTSRLSMLYTDLLLLSTFVFSILACRYWSYLLGAIGGVSLACVTIAAHNYFHRADNFRMYYFNFSLLSYREWRISHALSHHLFTNTVMDLEMLLFRPFLIYFPVEKGIVVRYLSWIYSPLLWMMTFHRTFIIRIASFLVSKDSRALNRSDLLPFILPLTMYLYGGHPFLNTILMWTFVVVVGSFHFTMVGINAAHHHPKVFHDGDAVRKNKDWGILQLDTVMDRTEITGSHYLVLTNFGDHALHHLFPTLDHGVLNYIYPVFEKTASEFGVKLRVASQLEMVKGQFLQLANCEPNPTPPDQSTVQKYTMM